jgi:hypothetical protein
MNTHCTECDSPKWSTMTDCEDCENPMCDKCPGAGEDAKGNLLCAKCVAKRNTCFYCDDAIATIDGIMCEACSADFDQEAA